MEYTVQDISPVKKKIDITVSPGEVDSALGAALALVKKDAQIDGFRKGKVPTSVVEKRFHDHIEKEARDNLINVHINDIVQKSGSKPVSPIVMEGEDKPLVKGQPYNYTMEFEVLPVFDLPPYEGMEVEEEEEDFQDQTERLVERMRKEKARLVPADGTGPAKDGQIAIVDFEPFMDGKPVNGFKATGAEIEVGDKSALPEFENLIKSIPLGHTGEHNITFPEDFIAPDLAGKTVVMKVTVHAIKDRVLPEVNDEFAKSLGYKDMADMRELLAKSVAQIMGNLFKAEAQNKLLQQLVKQTDFEIPPHLITVETYFLISDYAERMERQGKSVARNDEDFERLKKEIRPEGEARAREKVILLTIAHKEGLEISNEEVIREVFKGSQKMCVDFKEYYARMQDTGMIFQLRDNMLCDKAMDLVYDRANVKKVPLKLTYGEENGEAEDGGQEAAADTENNKREES